MTVVAPYEGKLLMLGSLLNKTEIADLQLKLFINNVAPDINDNASKYLEMSGYGYTPVTLLGGNWQLTQGIPCVGLYPEVTFSFSTGNNNNPIYGYFIVETSKGTLMWVERFNNPFYVSNAGDQLLITPRLTLG